MNNWHNPDWHYSFKSGMSFPNPAPAAEAAANSAAMAPPHHPYHGRPYGFGRGYYHRPRFGLFRRMVWFGLGVGAANWYIHHRDRRDQFMQCLSDRESSDESKARASDSFQEKNNHDWRGQWRFPHHPEVNRHTVISPQPAEFDSKVLSSLPSSPISNMQQEEVPKWGWGARRDERRKRKEQEQKQKQAVKDESPEEAEVQKIRKAVDKIWAERKQAAIDIQATANEKAKEYARVKLETLSQAVETLRTALDADAEKAKGPKIV